MKHLGGMCVIDMTIWMNMPIQISQYSLVRMFMKAQRRILIGLLIELNEAYPTNKFDETQNTHYYQINGNIVSISSFVTDANENIVSVGIQKMDDQ